MTFRMLNGPITIICAKDAFALHVLEAGVGGMSSQNQNKRMESCNEPHLPLEGDVSADVKLNCGCYATKTQPS